MCMLCRSLFVLLYFFFLAIVLSVLLRYTDSDYPFGIFKLFLYLININNRGLICHSLSAFRRKMHCFHHVRPSVTIVCTCKLSFILNRNSSKLCTLVYFHMKIRISLRQFDQIIFEGVKAPLNRLSAQPLVHFD
jgi:hypothetical protein